MIRLGIWAGGVYAGYRIGKRYRHQWWGALAGSIVGGLVATGLVGTS